MLAVKANNSFEAPTTETWWKELPFPFESVVVTPTPKSVGFRFSKFGFNIEARLQEQKIVACGEDDIAETAMTKAVAELLERAALFIAPLDATYAKNSNGWAAHPDHALARQNAIYELIERDAVLAQWYSTTPFFEMSAEHYPVWLKSWIGQELSRSELPRLRILISTQGLGPSVTCILMNDNGFGVCSHATRSTLQDSIRSATSEACRAAIHSLRRSAWNDTLALKENTFTQIEPIAHGLYYAFHEPFPDWMFGRQLTLMEASNIWEGRITEIAALDSTFSFSRVLETPLVVGVASHLNAFALSWGPTHAEKVAQSAGGIRLKLNTEAVNVKPHIVS